MEQEIGRKKETLGSMDGREDASVASQEAQNALATARSLIERYLRLRLSSAVLRRYIEHYREQNQDPIVELAGRIFSRITLESFAGLKIGFNEKDRPVLLGVRQHGDETNVDGMSDGTRDQLFLALRLASLHHQVDTGLSFPIFLDDALINFDDYRARATFESLVDLGRSAQVLFFTHHTHLVKLAHEAVPEESLRIHDLGEDLSPVWRED